MCGIAGIINRNGRVADKALLEAMVSVQRHRGPDDCGTFISGSAGLGHARLSIIDLSMSGHQPMANEDSTVLVIHNGEIYNYLELRTELKSLGHIFRSGTDTEVIVHAYEEWGEDCIKHFNGMWAFAALDLRKRELFCSRDRLGVKPFYYFADKETFIFASEIKAVLKHPGTTRAANDRAIFRYLSSGYGYMDTSEETFFEGVKQLKSAHFMKVPLNGEAILQKRYWDIDPGKARPAGTEKEVARRFNDIFTDAVRLRLRSDVPVGVSLSGGLDSSSIASVASGLMGDQMLETFSSCFDDPDYDERQYIQPVLDGTRSKANFIFTKSDDVFADLEEIMWHQEEPYSTLSIFPQWHVMRKAKEAGVKVLLNGQGGDELLGGYHKYYFYLFADLLRSLKFPSAAREIALYREKNGGAGVFGPVYGILMSYILPDFLKRIRRRLGREVPSYLNRDFAGRFGADTVPVERKFRSILNNDLYNALKISPLPSLLHIDDRSSMAHSIESRAPFLDYRLVEFAFSLGPEYKIHNGMTKYILRSSMKGRLPEKVLSRRDKMGFVTPLDKWFATALKDKVRDIFNSPEFRKRPYFDHDEVMAKFDGFSKGDDKSGQYTIWSWVNLELWLRRFINVR